MFPTKLLSTVPGLDNQSVEVILAYVNLSGFLLVLVDLLYGASGWTSSTSPSLLSFCESRTCRYVDSSMGISYTLGNSPLCDSVIISCCDDSMPDTADGDGSSMACTSVGESFISSILSSSLASG